MRLFISNFLSIMNVGGAEGRWRINKVPTTLNDRWRRQKLSATPDLSGTVLPLCLIPNSALKSAPPFKSVV
ncbi:hypothetical protein ACFZ9E_30370, partial [Pseudomonas aeruginosa]